YLDSGRSASRNVNLWKVFYLLQDFFSGHKFRNLAIYELDLLVRGVFHLYQIQGVIVTLTLAHFLPCKSYGALLQIISHVLSPLTYSRPDAEVLFVWVGLLVGF